MFYHYYHPVLMSHWIRLVLHQKHLRFEIITAVTMKNNVCLHVLLCSLTDCLLCPTLTFGVADSSEKGINFSNATLSQPNTVFLQTIRTGHHLFHML